MSSARPPLLKPAAFGLSAGMLLGAIYLAAKAVLLATSDCAPGAAVEDCLLEREIASEMSKFLSVFSLGLLLAGAGISVLSRPKKQDAS